MLLSIVYNNETKKFELQNEDIKIGSLTILKENVDLNLSLGVLYDVDTIKRINKHYDELTFRLYGEENNSVLITEEKGEKLEKLLTKYYKLRLEEMVNLRCELEDRLLEIIFEEWYAVEYEFWNNGEEDFEEFINEDKLFFEDIYSKVYSEDMYEISVEISDEYYDKPIEKNKYNNYMREVFQKYLPMVDVNKMLLTFKVVNLTFSDTSIEFEISSTMCGENFFVNTVIEIDENNNVYVNM